MNEDGGGARVPKTHPPRILNEFLSGEIHPVGLRAKVPERESWALAWVFVSGGCQFSGPGVPCT